MVQMPHLRASRADGSAMRTMPAPPAATTADRTGTLVDLIEDVLHLDQPVRPSIRRRVGIANEEALRTLRHLATEDEAILAPDNVRAICNAIATRHGVKPRFMLTTREVGEQLSFEFAAAALPPPSRARLIASAVHLEQRRAAADRVHRTGDRRPARPVEFLAAAQAVLAVVAVAGAVIMIASGRSTWGLGFAITSLSLVVMARAVLVLSADRLVHVLPGEGAAPAPVATWPSAGPDRPVDLEIDLRDDER